MPNTGLSPSVVAISKAFFYTTIFHIAALQPQRARPLVWPNPRSLATTCGITFVFFSSSYLDVSVRRVDNYCSQIFNLWGFPIRTRADQSVVCTYPRIFAAYRVLRRPQEPRHPPCALIHFLLLTWPYRPRISFKQPLRLLVWLNYAYLSTSIPSSLVNELLLQNHFFKTSLKVWHLMYFFRLGRQR